MNQKTAWAFVVVGLCALSYMVKEIIGDHQSWHELTTPQAVEHAAGVLGAFCAFTAGALGVDLSALIAKFASGVK